MKFHLHTYEEGNPEIKLNLLFRNFLRQSTDAQNEYANLKTRLIKQQSSHLKNNSRFTHYTFGKYDFIKKILDQAGFDSLRLMICTNQKEWEAYQRIKQEQTLSLEDGANHYPLANPNHYHFSLYKGSTIVGAAHVEFLKENKATLRLFFLDPPYQNKGWEKVFFCTLKKWLKRQGRTFLQPLINKAQ